MKTYVQAVSSDQVPLRVTVWSEFRQEKVEAKVKAVYPQGIHHAIAEGLTGERFRVNTRVLDDPDYGFDAECLESTDVLVYWGHLSHQEIHADVVQNVLNRIHQGMGFIALHSAFCGEIFRRLMGTPCSLKAREAGERERVWVVDPGHPIVAGLPDYFDLPQEEMYGEPFDVPTPDATVLISWFAGGEVFRSGLCYRRGLGRIFFFRPGHETYPTFYHPIVRKILQNAVLWAAPSRYAHSRHGYFHDQIQKTK